MPKSFLRLLIVFILIGCTTTQTTQLIADHYDSEKDQTTLMLLPHGTINIPGQWEKSSYNEVSRQHFFKNADTTSIAVAKNLKEKYPFYEQQMTDAAFAQKFFEWEKEFYEQQGFEINVLTSGNDYIVWSAKGSDSYTVLLYGAKGLFAYNFAVFSEDWPEKKRIDFLMNLFEENAQ